MQLFALLTLDFSSTPVLKTLISLHIVTRWLVLQKAPHHTYYVLWAVVSTQFQVLFHSPPGVLFTFPSQYLFTIGHQGIFRLGGWSPRLPTGFLVSRGTLDTASWLKISSTGLSPSLVCFPKTIRLSLANGLCSPQPQQARSLVWPVSLSLAAT